MEYLSFFEQATLEASRAFAEKHNLIEYQEKDYRHPQEDYLIASPPVFVVADGVTLNFRKMVEEKIKYPNPSPSGEVAKIFCESVVKVAKEKFDVLNFETITDIFKKSNQEVKSYNQQFGKTDLAGNITAYYAATGAFAVIKDNKCYFATICDSFVAHFDKNMNLKFMSSGRCKPYAVINGEEIMAEYIEKNTLDLEKEDRIFVFTDGFFHYVNNPDFLNFFKEWSGEIKSKVDQFSKEMNLQDPTRYGKERSLIV